MHILPLVLTTISLLNYPITKASSNDFIYNELNQDSSFNANEFKINKNISNHNEFKGVLLHEHPESDLIFYVFNVTGFQLLDPSDCRISLAFNSDDYNHYSLDYLGNTNDYKFYKFKINDLKVDSSISSREYKIGEFETKQERVYVDSNAVGLKPTDIYISSSISQNYKYSGESYECYSLTTLTLDVHSSYYRVPGSTTAIPFDGVANNDIFYIYFLMPKQYGELIKIDMEWYENFSHYYTESGSLDSHDYSDSYQNKYFREIVSNEDKTIIDENKNFFWNPYNWFEGGSKGVNLKNLQRLGVADLGKINSNDNDFCLSDETKKDLNDWLKNPANLINNDPYVIRYSIKEFYKKQSTHQGALGYIYTTTEYKLYSMKDIDLITCTFLKDGIEYTLSVVSNTNNQSVGSETVPNKDWQKALAIIGIVLVLILLIPILPYIIQLIVWIIKLPFKCIKWIISLFKKDNKKKK